MSLMRWLVLLGCVPICAVRAASPLSPQAQEAISPVHQALERTREQQGRKGQPESVSEQLVRLGELDQAPRAVLPSIDLSKLPADERDATATAMWEEINEQDAANQSVLLTLMPPTGWFTADRYGTEAAEAAWSVIQHAIKQPSIMKDALARMTPAALAGLVNPDDFGRLADRVAMLDGEPQSYGTQFVCADHRWGVYSLIDPEHVEERRHALGMTETQEQESARIAKYPPCYPPK
ncbi:MAG: DUF6624 domain-containing protein [Aliidongia sp.]